MLAPWRVTVGGGGLLFTTSQSKAVSHLLKPDVRLGFSTRHLGLEVGAEVQAVASDEPGYRLMGALATLGVPLVDGEIFELDLTLAVGPGTDARILHYDLASEDTLTVWARLGLGLHWWLPGDRVALGLTVDVLNLTVIGLDAALTFRL